MIPDLLAIPKDVSRQEFITIAREFIGIPYVSGKAWVNEIDGKLTGHCDCVGFPLLAIRRAGWLPPECPCDLPVTVFGRQRDDILREMITLNMHAISLDAALPGDIYFVRYSNNDGERGSRHFMIKSTFEPVPLGSIIHSWCDLRGEGAVFEQRLTQAVANCIVGAWRFNSWR